MVLGRMEGRVIKEISWGEHFEVREKPGDRRTPRNP